MEIVVWTQPNCAYCTRVKSLLDMANLIYEEKDIGPNDSAAREEFKMFHATTPQVYINGTWLDDRAFQGDSVRTISNFIAGLDIPATTE